MTRARLSAALLTAALMTQGCAHYAPAPIALDALPRRLDAARLDDKPPGVAWTSTDLLAAAMSRNPTIAEAAAKYRTAQAAAKAARVGPSITLTLTAEYAKDPSASSRWLYGAGSDIPLDIGPRRDARLSSADLTAVQALYDFGEALWTVRTALRRAIVARQAADEELTLALAWSDLRRKRADRLERRVVAGEDDRSAALVARADLNTAERRVAEARSRRDAADSDLAGALGLTPQAVRALALTPETPSADPEDLVARRRAAALNRRDVLRAVIDYDLAEQALRLEIARQYPEIHIGPGYTWERGLTKLPFNLGLVLPPTDLNRAAIAQAEAKRAEAGRSLEAVQAAALGGVDQAQTALASARALETRIARDEMKTVERQAAGALRAARAGETDMTDALQAQAAVIETQLALADARKTSALAVVDLEDALRAPFAPTEAAVLDQSLKTLGAAR